MGNSIRPNQVEKLRLLLDVSTKLLTAVDGVEYTSLIARWADNASKNAGAVAVPMQDSEVAKLVKFASDENLDLAVRGGGHSTGGTSSTDGGMVVDLSSMRKVYVDRNAQLITAQGGALWADVDDAAAKNGLATVGGTVNHTGVGGLTLGGGFGWLSGQYGTVVDNLVSAKIVIADGTIHTVSADENRELFWAIRGAGHNFGITTEFTFQAHEQLHDVYAGALVFTPDKLAKIIVIMNELAAGTEPRGSGMVAFAQPPDAPGPLLVVSVFFNGTLEEAEKHFSTILELQPIANMTKMMPYKHVNSLMNHLAPHGGRKSIKAVSFPLDVDPKNVLNLWEEFTGRLHQNPDLKQSFMAVEFYSLARVMSVETGDMAFANRGPYRAGIIGLSWSNPDHDFENRAWGRSLQERCRSWINTAQGPSAKPNRVVEYANYLEPDDLLEDASFGPNQERLATLKSRYDPGCLFHKTAPITPKAP